MGWNNPDGITARLTPVADTNIAAPTVMFLMAAWKHARGQAAFTIALSAGPVLLIGGIVLLIFPQLLSQAMLLLVIAWAAATVVAQKTMVRDVIVIRMDGERPCIDLQSWWKSDERMIPDALKHAHRGQVIAWLYEVTEEVTDPVTGEVTTITYLTDFDAWEQSLDIGEGDASAAYIAGIKTTMKASEDMASYQEADNSEIARYGLLTLIILAGLLAVYLAGTKAIDTFIAPPV